MTFEEQLERPSSKLEATDPSLFADLPMENINDGPAETGWRCGGVVRVFSMSVIVHTVVKEHEISFPTFSAPHNW